MTRRHWCLAALLLTATACTRLSAVPAIQTGNVELKPDSALQWATYEGRLIFVVLSPGGDNTHGVLTSIGKVIDSGKVELNGERSSGTDAPWLQWRITTADGRAGLVQINTETFALDRGAVFVVGDDGKVKQHDVPLAGRHPDDNTWQDLKRLTEHR